MRTLLTTAAAVVVLASAACGGGSSSSAKPATDQPVAATVKSEGTTWTPESTKVKVGETVEWNVDGTLVHNLSGDDGVKHAAASKFTVTHVFKTPGTYAFQCTIHPGMKGTIEAS